MYRIEIDIVSALATLLLVATHALTTSAIRAWTSRHPNRPNGSLSHDASPSQNCMCYHERRSTRKRIPDEPCPVPEIRQNLYARFLAHNRAKRIPAPVTEVAIAYNNFLHGLKLDKTEHKEIVRRVNSLITDDHITGFMNRAFDILNHTITEN